MSRTRYTAAAVVALLALTDASQTTYALTRPDGRFTEVSAGPAAIAGTHGLAVMVSVGLAASLLVAGALLVRLPWPSARWTLWCGAAGLACYKGWVVAMNFTELLS